MSAWDELRKRQSMYLYSYWPDSCWIYSGWLKLLHNYVAIMIYTITSLSAESDLDKLSACILLSEYTVI